MNVDVSPDGTVLTFDLLGDVYLLPVDGGVATQLTSGREWDQAPRFSLDGANVYFVSDRIGAKSIWRLTLADRSLQQITRSDSDILGGPNWSQNGRRLLAGVGDAYTRNTEVILQSIDPGTGTMTVIDSPNGPWVDMDTFESKRPAVKIFSGVESVDGEVFFSQAKYDEKLNRTTVRLYKFDRKTRSRTAITSLDASYDEYKPQLSHDGSLLAYFRQYHDRRTEIRILSQTTGQNEALIELTNADDASYSPSDDSRPNYAFTPNDRHLIFWHDGKIHRVHLADGSSEIVPFRVRVEREVWARAQPSVKHLSRTGEAQIVRWPNLSSDGRTMTFAALGYLWIMDLETDHIRRLTNSSDFEYMPALSPDGKSVAYTSFAQTDNHYGSGRLLVVDVHNGAQRELLAAPNEAYLLPKWSQDGKKIAVIREVDVDTDSKAFFGWTKPAAGEFHEVAPAPASKNRSSFRIYARFVGFDEAGQHLLFSHPTSRTKTLLVKARLDGRDLQTLAVGDADVGGIVPAPDLKSLVLTRRDGTVWVAPFKVGPEPVMVSTSDHNSRRASEGGGYYVAWNDREQITYGFGKKVYRYSLDRSGLEVRPIKVSLAIPTGTQPIAFKGARLVTVSDNDDAERVIESGTILLRGRRIAAVGPVDDVTIPANALVIDGAGTTILPGLLDTHYHRIGGIGFSAFALPNTYFSDRSAMAYGVTTAWEPGGAANDGVPAMVDLQRAGRIAGPRWSHSAMGAVGYPFELLTTYSAALSAVEQHQSLGVAVLKEYNAPTRQQRQWLSTAAHEYGLGIVSHIESFDGMMTRVVDGFTGGDHPYIPVPFFKDVHELLRQTGYIWTPNIVISSGNVGGYSDVQDYYWQYVLEHRPDEREKLIAMTPAGHANQILGQEPSVAYDIHRVSRVAKQAAAASKNGVHIGISAHNMPGVNLHGELWFLWKGGLQIEDVLRAATIGNAEKLGFQNEVGSLEPGKIADLLVLNENPLDDIINTLSLKYTVMDGIVYDSDTAQQSESRVSMSDSKHSLIGRQIE
jgi:Tol biopolymer transport system component